jgi:hypothetical protein
MPTKRGSKYVVTPYHSDFTKSEIYRLFESEASKYNRVTSLYSDAEITSQLLSHTTVARDVELADFIDERMPLDRERKGIPKSLLYEAKDEFGLSSKSSILRAYRRGKKWKSDALRVGLKIGKRNP